MTTITHPPETNRGVVTSWLPLTSTFSLVPECATGGIYSDTGGGLAMAYDPLYGLRIDRALTCLPPIATLWWNQSSSTPILTRTNFGPFMCPGGYTTAMMSPVDAITTFVGCCPSSYTFMGTRDPGSAGQCNSPISIGQVLTFMDVKTWSKPSLGRNTITNEGASVFGIHVNGYIFATPSVTGLSSSGSSAINTGAITVPTSTTSTTATIISVSSGLGTGAKAGIGVGICLGVLGVCSLIAGFILIRRSRRNRVPVYHTARGQERQQVVRDSATVYEIQGTPKNLK